VVGLFENVDRLLRPTHCRIYCLVILNLKENGGVSATEMWQGQLDLCHESAVFLGRRLGANSHRNFAPLDLHHQLKVSIVVMYYACAHLHADAVLLLPFASNLG
jgi:hypothetical protein